MYKNERINGIMNEQSLALSIAEYLKNGGKIKRYRSRADEIAAKIHPRSKYVQYDVLRQIKADNDRKRQQAITLKNKRLHAGDSAGRIEPCRPSKTWPNRYKKCVQPAPV